MSLPVEIWQLVQEFVPPNIFSYITFSQISPQAKIAFLGNKAWSSINPHKVEAPAEHFLQTYASLSQYDRENLFLVWTRPAKYIVWAANTGQMPSLDQPQNLYYKLGFLVNTAGYADLLKPKIKCAEYELMLCAVKLNVQSIYNAAPQLLHDADLAFEVVSRCGRLLYMFPPEIREMKRVLLAAVQNHGAAIRHAPLDKWEDAEIIKAAVVNDHEVLVYPEIRAPFPTVTEPYKLLVLHAIRNTPPGENFFTYASLPSFLQTDKDIVLESFNKYPHTLPHFKYMESALRLDPELCRQAVKKHGSALAIAPLVLRQDRDLVIQAVQTYGAAIAYASPELRADPEVALAAVTQDGKAFISIDPSLYENEEIFLKAVETDSYPLEMVEKFKSDLRALERAVDVCPDAFSLASQELRNNKKLALRAVLGDGMTLEFASEQLRGDLEVVWRAVTNAPQSLQFASPELQDSEEVVRRALINDGSVLRYASSRLQCKKPLLLLALATSKEAVSLAAPFVYEDHDIALASVRQMPKLLSMIERSALPLDRQLVVEAVKRDGSVLSIATGFHDNDEVVTNAVMEDGCALIYASRRLQLDDRLVALSDIAGEIERSRSTRVEA